ncbi:glycosyltransferase [Staphylococcus aureus]
MDELEGITFLLACYNESETIEICCRNVVLKYEKKEIIIINDGSSDNTAELIL